MSIFMNRKNVRTNKSNLMRLISSGSIDKRSIIREGAYILFHAVPYAFAKRILSKCDIEVENNNEWNFIRNMDYAKLDEFYKDEKKESDLIINREGNISIVLNDEVKIEPEIIEVEKVREDIVEIEEAIEEVEPEHIVEEEPIPEPEEEVIEETVTTELAPIDISEEPILKTSDEEEIKLEEIEEEETIPTEEDHNSSYPKDINNFTLNKPHFKKKKKKSQQ